MSRVMSRVIKILEKYPPKLTVKELIDLIKTESASEKIKEADLIESIKNKFKNTYLKRAQDGMFGEELEVLHIHEITGHEKSVDWEGLFHVRGEKISFNKGHIFYRGFSGDSSSDLYSKNDLIGMEVISKSDYDYYLNQYNSMNDIINSLLKKG